MARRRGSTVPDLLDRPEPRESPRSRDRGRAPRVWLSAVLGPVLGVVAIAVAADRGSWWPVVSAVLWVLGALAGARVPAAARGGVRRTAAAWAVLALVLLAAGVLPLTR